MRWYRIPPCLRGRWIGQTWWEERGTEVNLPNDFKAECVADADSSLSKVPERRGKLTSVNRLNFWLILKLCFRSTFSFYPQFHLVLHSTVITNHGCCNTGASEVFRAFRHDQLDNSIHQAVRGISNYAWHLPDSLPSALSSVCQPPGTDPPQTITECLPTSRLNWHLLIRRGGIWNLYRWGYQ